MKPMPEYVFYYIDGLDAEPVLVRMMKHNDGKDVYCWLDGDQPSMLRFDYEYAHNIGPELLKPVEIRIAGEQPDNEPFPMPDAGDPLSLIIRGAIQSEVERQLLMVTDQEANRL